MKMYLLALIIVVLAVAGFLWWQTISQEETGQQPTETPTQDGLGNELYQNIENPADSLPAVNPLENKPEVNPLNEANPFSNIKTNPFK